MEKGKGDGDKPENQNELNGLFEFTNAIRAFTQDFKSEGLDVAKRLKNEEVSLLLTSSFDNFGSQFDRLCAFAEDKAMMLTTSQKSEINVMMSYNVGASMTKSLTTTLRTSFARGSGSNFLQWIAAHIKELKKLLEMLLDAIFQLFGLEVPKWIIAIINFIDEFGNIILSLLEGLFGGDIEGMKQTLHNDEVRFLREMTEVQRYRMVSRNTRTMDE